MLNASMPVARVEQDLRNAHKMWPGWYFLPGLIAAAMTAFSIYAIVLFPPNMHTSSQDNIAVMENYPLAGDISPTSLVAVGDVMLSRKVGKLMDSNGLEYPLAGIRDVLKQADITFGNLESPLSRGGAPLPGKGIWFRARPEAVASLKEAGFDVMSLANNHALDYDSPALLDTVDILTGNGIAEVGGGSNIAEARRPEVIEINGEKIIFLAYSDMAEMYWSSKYPRQLRATGVLPGIAPLKVDEILADMARAKKKAEIVVLSLHWGVEYADEPTPGQRDLAHRLIDGGADLIIGHHPHTLQGVEVYHQGLILYSLGNFVFDQYFSQETQEGLMLQALLSPFGLQQAKILPVILPQSRPELAQGETALRILEKTRALSLKLNTHLRIVDNGLVVDQIQEQSGDGVIKDAQWNNIGGIPGKVARLP
ncbi:MAG: CapA family protein [Bacillota bacterium]